MGHALANIKTEKFNLLNLTATGFYLYILSLFIQVNESVTLGNKEETADAQSTQRSGTRAGILFFCSNVLRLLWRFFFPRVHACNRNYYRHLLTYTSLCNRIEKYLALNITISVWIELSVKGFRNSGRPFPTPTGLSYGP